MAPQVFDDAGVTKAFAKVVDYQLARIQDMLAREFKQYAAEAPKPAIVFSPYFYIDPTNPSAWIDVAPKAGDGGYRAIPRAPGPCCAMRRRRITG